MKPVIPDYGMPNQTANVIAEDKNVISYRPKLNKATGSVLATILLQQMMYWAKRTGNKFYKFVEPCDHALYQESDSWCEELGFSPHEFRTAIKKIGFKLGKRKENNSMPKDEAFIIYFTDSNRLTWYSVNWKAVNKMLDSIYLVNADSAVTKENAHSVVTSFTEITTETTSYTGECVSSIDKEPRDTDPRGITEIWEHYLEEMNPFIDIAQIELTPKFKRIIAKRMKELPIDTIKQSITNVSWDKYQTGKHEKNSTFLATIDSILRSKENVQKWASMRVEKSNPSINFSY